MSSHPIARRRHQLGLSQEALAERSGISTHAISRAETFYGVNLTTLHLLADALETDARNLLYRPARKRIS